MLKGGTSVHTREVGEGGEVGLEKGVVGFVRFGMRSGDSGDMAPFGSGGKCWSHYDEGWGWSTLLSEVLAAWQRSWPRVGQKIRTRGRLTLPG